MWAIIVLFGVGALASHSGAPGRSALAPPAWPAGLELGPNGSLVLFAHPGCPCTRATLTQLARLRYETRQDAESAPQIYVILARGANEPDSGLTALWRDSDPIPGVVAVSDSDGETRRRFGTYTSGQTLLYGSSGRLLFAGGLTASRGHQGDSTGLVRLREALRSHHAQPTADVYGCPLFAQADELCQP